GGEPAGAFPRLLGDLVYLDTLDRWLMLAANAQGSAPTNGPVSISDDDGESWRVPTSSPPTWFEHRQLLTSPGSTFVVSVGGQSSFQSFWSVDGGENWSVADSYTGNTSSPASRVFRRSAVLAGSLYVAHGAGFCWK